MNTKSTRHIPIFIPHLGCPHCCVFCDQRTISDRSSFSLHGVRAQIDAALSTIDRARTQRVEIAYFGGSFTAIDRPLMHALLCIAQSYVDTGAVDAIRFSTRPDAVDEALLDELSPYGISAIELGLQSLDDGVLLAAQRGHSADVAEDACRRIVARGYTLTGQTMLGLPKSSYAVEEMTARRICALGATEARIYPTVVLKGTALAEQMTKGDYVPLTVAQAVTRAASLLDIFDEAGVRCLRIGLCENEGLRAGSVAGGAHHPALGELVYGEQLLCRMRASLNACGQSLSGMRVQFSVASGKCSQALGQHRRNVVALQNEYGVNGVLIRENAALKGAQVCLDAILPDKF